MFPNVNIISHECFEQTDNLIVFWQMSDLQTAIPEPQLQCQRADRLGAGWADSIRQHFDAQDELRRLREKERISLYNERLSRFFGHALHQKAEK